MKNLIFSISFFAFALAFGQSIAYPPLSPKGSLTQVIGNTTFKIEYERPSVRNRVIFGNLVPFGKVWRTGAGGCTKISFDKPVKLFEQIIPAGKYSLFTKPSANEWMIMLNKDTTLRGSRKYQPSQDIIQILANPEKTKRVYETMTFDIEMRDNNAWISLSWDRTQVRFLMETTTNDEINEQIKERLLSHESTDAKEYAGGSRFLVWRGEDLITALILADRAIELDIDQESTHRLRLDICEKLEKYQEALDETNVLIDILRAKGGQENAIQKLMLDKERIAKLKKKQK